MNAEEYISSGIVETYVLGLADDAERAEFQQMCRRHPEVMAARVSFETALQDHAFKNAVTPPPAVSKAVFDQLGLHRKEGIAPVFSIDTPVNGISAASSGSRLKYIAAASVILLIGSALLNFYLFGRYKDYNNRYTELLASQQQLVKNNEVMQAKMHTYEEDLNLVNDTNVIMIRMPGSNVASSPAPASLATVYWHKQSKDVYVHVNSMPEPPADKQYQLWAMVDGRPVDAGVFDMSKEISIVKMKNIPRAQAFAVTLEKKGGSPSPTMEQLYIMGKV